MLKYPSPSQVVTLVLTWLFCTQYNSPSIDLEATRVTKHKCNQISEESIKLPNPQTTLMRPSIYSTVLCPSRLKLKLKHALFPPPQYYVDGIE